jgi:hypothetical protein
MNKPYPGKRVFAHGRRAAGMLIGVLVLLGTTAAVYAATSAPDFSISAQPPTQSIDAQQSATYVISIAPANGFTGPATLTVGGLAKSMSSSWSVGSTTTSSASTTLPAGAGTHVAILTIATGNTPPDTYTPSVTAVSGSLTHTVALNLGVQDRNAVNFGLSVNPMTQTVAQGSTTSTIAVTRTNWSGAVSFAVSGLPAGASAAVTPGSTANSSAQLTITATSSTPPGLYTVVVAGTGVLYKSAAAAPTYTTATRYAAFTLNVLAPFAISGNLTSPLTLGSTGTQPLDVAITNPYGTPLTVSNIMVTLNSVQAAAQAKGTCSQTGANSPNFRVDPLPAGYSVTVPANTTAKLSQLGNGRRPTVTWIDQPWLQNGCLGASLSFGYTGTGQF